MREVICTCHCGGSMFYRHMHAESCELSRVGEEAPKSELQALRDEVARLRGALQTIATWDARSTSQRIQTFAKAALTPQAGKGQQVLKSGQSQEISSYAEGKGGGA